MQDRTIRAIAEDAAAYQETNPCDGMDFYDLKNAERNLKEVLRFVRMARVAEQIKGQNRMEYSDQY
jgi:hypothetical protein